MSEEKVVRSSSRDIGTTAGEIIAELKAVLEESSTWTSPEYESNRTWTKEILNRLSELGKAKGFEPCASCESAAAREWLYDICWIEYDSQRYFKDVWFAGECEWAGHEDSVWDDFGKVLQSNAKLRLMIYEANSKRNGEIKSEQCQEAIRRYRHHLRHCLYVIAQLDNFEEAGDSDLRFQFKTVEVTPGREARIELLDIG